MKKWFSKKRNLFFLLLLAFVLFQQLPVIGHNLSQEDKMITSRVVKVYKHEESSTIVFPPKDARAIAIFWASWCGPCKIEMKRLQKSVESGAIAKKSLFAINPFESDGQVKKFLKENNYPFTFIEASSLDDELGVKVTPTTVFIENGKITQMNSGMSIWGIWKAELYF